MSTSKQSVDDYPLWMKFLTAGTAACIADLATFPLDTAKVRMQVNIGTGNDFICINEKEKKKLKTQCDLEARAFHRCRRVVESLLEVL